MDLVLFGRSLTHFTCTLQVVKTRKMKEGSEEKHSLKGFFATSVHHVCVFQKKKSFSSFVPNLHHWKMPWGKSTNTRTQSLALPPHPSPPPSRTLKTHLTGSHVILVTGPTSADQQAFVLKLDQILCAASSQHNLENRSRNVKFQHSCSLIRNHTADITSSDCAGVFFFGGGFAWLHQIKKTLISWFSGGATGGFIS